MIITPDVSREHMLGLSHSFRIENCASLLKVNTTNSSGLLYSDSKIIMGYPIIVNDNIYYVRQSSVAAMFYLGK